jgi:hypothetical protein
MADTKLTDLDEIGAALVGTDIAYVVDDPGGTPLSRKSTVQRFKDFALEFASLTAKTTPVGADSFAINDSAASGSPKKVTWANLKAGLKTWLTGEADPTSGLGENGDFYLQTGTGDVGVPGDIWEKAAGTWSVIVNIQGEQGAPGSSNVAESIVAADAKTTPHDNDLLGLVDSEASNVLKKLSWANVKATLGVFAAASFTPTVSFGTPGDLNVSYDQQVGFSQRVGGLVFVTFDVTFTPTYTTASGNLSVAGHPVAIGSATVGVLDFSVGNFSASIPTFPTSTSAAFLQANNGSDIFQPRAQGSATNSPFTVTQITSGTKRRIRASIFYEAA